MKQTLRIKLFLYRFVSTAIGKSLLRLLSVGVKVKHFGNGKIHEHQRFSRESKNIHF